MDNYVDNYMETETKTFLRQISAQATSILLAAAGAALLTFIQSVATLSGACDVPTALPEQAGALGAGLKTIHSAFALRRGTMFA